MRFTFLLILFVSSYSLSSQSVASYVITSAGNSIMSEDGAIYLSVGEPMNTELTGGDIMVSQGFLQVTIQGSIVNDEDLLEDLITVFPNPTMDRILIKSDQTAYSYQFYDLQGKPLTQKLEIDTDASIDMTVMPVGTYLLTLHREGKSTRSIKIIKQ